MNTTTALDVWLSYEAAFGLASCDIMAQRRAGGVDARVPIVPALDARILEMIAAATPPDCEPALQMTDWHHNCGSAHCRGGWAVVAGGHLGRALERQVGTAEAASLIYAASRPGLPIPDFYNHTNEEAMMSLREDAGAMADPRSK